MVWKLKLKRDLAFQKISRKSFKRISLKTFRGKLLWRMLALIGGSAAIVFCVMIVFILLNLKQSVNQLTSSDLAAKSQAASYQLSNYFEKYIEITRQICREISIYFSK